MNTVMNISIDYYLIIFIHISSYLEITDKLIMVSFEICSRQAMNEIYFFGIFLKKKNGVKKFAIKN